MGNPLLLSGLSVAKGVLSEMRSNENPLINNKKLRQLYVAITGMRVLDESVSALQRKGKMRHRLASTRGEEACRVSTAIELIEGDLVSDTGAGVAMDFLAGATVTSLLRRVTALGSGTTEPRARLSGTKRFGQMPWTEDAGERLQLAVGAALAFKTLKHSNLVVKYVRREEFAGRAWRRGLTLASRFELPMIFVVLPEASSKKPRVAGDVSAKARSCGVPGIPVDRNDAVALYRVAQESIGRARGGGGPVLIECVAPPLGQRAGETADPIIEMKAFLLGRKVCTEAWLDRVGGKFKKRLEETQVRRHGSTRA